MKRTLSILLALVLLLCALPLTVSAADSDLADTGADSDLAETGYSGYRRSGDYDLDLSGSRATIVKYYGSESYLSIPKTFRIGRNDYTTDWIGWVAFEDNSSLVTVSIPDTVVVIDPFAFNNCNNLAIVSLGAGVGRIGNAAFQNCPLLTTVLVGKDLQIIEPYAFNNCSSLKNISLPDTVTSIGKYAFKGCAALESIHLSNKLTSIEDSTFYGCSSLKSVTIPDSVTSIGEWAFGHCTSLESVNLSKNLTSIGDAAFDSCSSLKSVTIPDSVTSIGEWAFDGCSSLKSITIPDSVTSIGEWAFWGCTSLESINLNKKLTSIELGTFYGCESLKSITIPDSVKSIGANAFEGCTDLKGVTIYATLEEIGEQAFVNCENLKSVTIPSKTTKIDDHALGYIYTYNDDDVLIGIKQVEDFTIYGFKDSTAQSYAYQNGFKFIPLDADVEPDPDPGSDPTTMSAYGMVTSYLDSDEPVTVELSVRYYLSGSLRPRYRVIGTQTIYGNNAGYRFSDLPAGTYQITLSKKNHVSRTYSIVLVDSSLLGGKRFLRQNLVINPLGDINGDGKLNARDVSAVNGHFKGKLLTGYALDCADANGDGSVTTRDVIAMNAHLKGKKSLWK